MFLTREDVKPTATEPNKKNKGAGGGAGTKKLTTQRQQLSSFIRTFEAMGEKECLQLAKQIQEQDNEKRAERERAEPAKKKQKRSSGGGGAEEPSSAVGM